MHAGDIGHSSVLVALGTLAPVTAVRGNNDKGTFAEAVPGSGVLQIGETFVYVLHDLATLDLDPKAAGFHVVVSGHSHRPSIKERDGVLYVNPGSAGPRRFKLPIAVADLQIKGPAVRARIVELSL